MVQVTFSQGRDFLKAYWGYLSHGGLMLDHAAEARVGEPISIHVRIESVDIDATLPGHVVRCDEDGRVIVAFAPEGGQDVVLSAALAECDGATARRDCRYSVSCQALLGGEPVQIVNVSKRGLCIATRGWPAHGVGSPLYIQLGGQMFAGEVRWVASREIGVALNTKQCPIEAARSFEARL